jgi:putative sterol carrier protein
MIITIVVWGNWLYNRRKEINMTDPTISDFMSQLGAAFIPEKAAGVDATIQINLTGATAEVWNVVIKDGQCKLAQGTTPVPKLTVTTDSDNFIKIFIGQLDGMQAFMQGKLKLAGDLNLAMKLLGLFKMNK